jgi:hypothetical protein
VVLAEGHMQTMDPDLSARQPADAPDPARTTRRDESHVTNCSEQAGRPRGIYGSEACLPGLQNLCAIGSGLTVIQSAP